MSKINKQHNYGRWFWKKYWKYVIIGIVTLLLFYSSIYFIFAFSSLIPAGKNLSRADWLSFIGGSLGLMGSIVVSVISITQASYFNEMEQKRQDDQRKFEEERRHNDRILEIKPELAIVIKDRNVRIPIIDGWPSDKLFKEMFGKEQPVKTNNNVPLEKNILNQIHTYEIINNYPVDNVWISIVNICKYPINHIEIYGEYYFPFIQPGNCINIILTLDSYPRKLDCFSSSKGLDYINELVDTVKIIDVRNEKIDISKAHVENPKQYDSIWIDFEDIDGNSYYQVFRIHPSGVGLYYCNDEMVMQGGYHDGRK